MHRAAALALCHEPHRAAYGLACLQHRELATTGRAGLATDCTPGSWRDIHIILTHQDLPPEVRYCHRSQSAAYLKRLRGCSAVFNKLGLYMLQCDEIGYMMVSLAHLGFWIWCRAVSDATPLQRLHVSQSRRRHAADARSSCRSAISTGTCAKAPSKSS